LISEKQFAGYFSTAAHKQGVTGTVLLQMLETRLDNIVAKAGFASGRKQSRQLIRHRHFLVNERIVDIPSYRVKAGDTVGVKLSSMDTVKTLISSMPEMPEPKWLSVDKLDMKIKILALPDREDMDPTVKEQLIVEYYSK
jgi:small subunit ribosomal protein S4